jgi:sugar phosphate isomerase/epimerase
MKPLHTLLLALCAGAAACSPNQQDTPAQSGPGGGQSGIALSGDFRGPLGVQLYSFRDAFKTDVPGTLARVRALGFREVETAGTYGLTPQQFRQELDRAGLRATSMHVGYERLRDDLPGALAEAKTLGARYLGVAWIPHQGPFTEETARRTAADFNRWGAAAKQQGLQFFYHIHGYEFRPTASGSTPFDLLMQLTDAENVKYEIDVFWAARPGQDPAALIRKYPNRWKLMHIKDMKAGTSRNDHSGGAPPNETEVPTGQGILDYRGVLRAAREAGLDHYYIEDETSSPFETVPQSIQWLQSVRFGGG